MIRDFFLDWMGIWRYSVKSSSDYIRFRILAEISRKQKNLSSEEKKVLPNVHLSGISKPEEGTSDLRAEYTRSGHASKKLSVHLAVAKKARTVCEY